MRRLVPAVSLALLLALGACDDPPQGAQSGPEVAAANDTTPDALQGSIPPALQRRWGLTENDCTTTMGDDKGLLTIDADSLEFYESRGTLGVLHESEENRVDADFSFTGEGMLWERRMTLELQDDGQILIRREFGEEAAPEPFRYMRCPQ